MIVHRFSPPPDYDGYVEDELTGIADAFKNFNLDEVWYWYARASYEGAGYLIMRQGDLWDSHALGHCS